MAEVIGGVEWTGSLNNRGLPAQAEKAGQEMGAAGAKGYDEKWQKGFRDTLSESGKKSYDTWTKQGRKDGTTYSTGLKTRLDSFLKDAQKNFQALRLDPGFLDDFAKGFDSADGAAGELQRQLKTLRDETDLHPASYAAAKRQLDGWYQSQKNLKDDVDKAVPSFKALREEFDKNGTSAHNLGLKWSDLSANTRQWTAIIAVIASAGEEIAALGSAAGGGLAAIGGAATGLIAGVGAVALVFRELNTDASKLPPDLRSVANEFAAFKTSLGDVQTIVARGAFPQMAGDFQKLSGIIRTLDPQFASLGGVVGHLFDDMVTNLAGGNDALLQIQTALGLASGNFDSMARSAGTLGLAMLRAFNGAQPLVQGLLDYVKRLADQFDAFTQSDGLTQWFGHTETIFKAIGPLLDAVGRGLNDLVTDASVQRTADFLNNVTGFVPNLTQILQILGNLDVFGLLAQALNDIGTALSPLYPALQQVATAVSGALSSAISGAATVLGAFATALTPLVTVLGELIAAIPAPVLQAIAGGLTALAIGMGAVAAVKGLAGIATSFGNIASEGVAVVQIFASIAKTEGISAAIKGVAGDLTGLSGSFDKAAGSAKGFVGAAGGLVGKAGAIGGLVAVGVAAGVAINGLITSLENYTGKATAAVAANKNLVQSSQDIFGTLSGAGKQLGGTSLTVDNLSGALHRLTVESQNGGPLWASFNGSFQQFSNQAQDLRGTLTQLDAPMAALAQNNMPAVAQQMQSWQKETGATNDEMYAMITTMGGFNDQLTKNVTAQGLVADQTSIVNEALGENSDVTGLAAGQTATQAAALQVMSGHAADATGSVDSLSTAIAGLATGTLSARSAQRDFQAAVDNASASVKTNGTTLDINTAKGRANQAALDDIASSAIAVAGATYKQTGSVKDATTAIDNGRAALIKQLGQFGITGKAAQDYADKLQLTPDAISTVVKLSGVSAAEQQLDNLAKTRYALIIAETKLGGGGNLAPGGSGNGGTAHAAGTITSGPEIALIGEAGREAVVPLDRPIDQVDPSVRWLAAIAQGKTAPTPMASGGVAGGGTRVVIEAGAIVVQGAQDPAATAIAVLNRVAEVLY